MDENKEQEEQVTLPEVAPSGIKEKISRWKVGDYIRQLSIVVLGIVITFLGSDIISNYGKQKEIRSAMQLVKAELEENRKSVELAWACYAEDCTSANLIEKYHFSVDALPEDSLCFGLFNRFNAFTPIADAIGVLKSSGLMQHMSDKQLSLLISRTYDQMNTIGSGLDSYYTLKDKVIGPIGLAMSDQERELMGGNSPGELYRVYVKYQEIRNFVGTVSGYLPVENYTRTLDLLDKAIQAIEEKYE